MSVSVARYNPLKCFVTISFRGLQSRARITVIHILIWKRGGFEIQNQPKLLVYVSMQLLIISACCSNQERLSAPVARSNPIEFLWIHFTKWTTISRSIHCDTKIHLSGSGFETLNYLCFNAAVTDAGLRLLYTCVTIHTSI